MNYSESGDKPAQFCWHFIDLHKPQSRQIILKKISFLIISVNKFIPAK